MADEPIITDESVTVAAHGLKNELSRLHQLHQNALIGAAEGVSPDEVWTRILVIEEALLNMARAYSTKMEKEAVAYEKGIACGGKQLPRSANSRPRRMRK